MMCEVKSLTYADSEVRTVSIHKLESIGYIKQACSQVLRAK